MNCPYCNKKISNLYRHFEKYKKCGDKYILRVDNKRNTSISGAGASGSGKHSPNIYKKKES